MPVGRSRWSAAAALALGAGAALLLAELSARGVFHAREGRLTLPVRETPDPPAAPGTPPGDEYQVHPYLGFSIRPGVSVFAFHDTGGRGRAIFRAKLGTDELPAWAHVEANNLGFFSPVDYPTDSEGRFQVGIFGGSLSMWASLQARARMTAALAALPQLAGRRVEVLSFAVGGYKQPQQLLLLGFLASVGQELDVVLNLDGFNEAALGWMNARAGYDVSMPSGVHLQGLEVVERHQGRDLEATAYLGELARLQLESARQEHRRDRSRWALSWWVRDLRLSRLRARRRALAEAPPADSERLQTLMAILPAGRASDEQLAARIASDWARASDLMAGLARRMGARYLHVLQPNQHAGAHVFGAEEARVAIDDASPYRAGVEHAYPQMRGLGPHLRRSGVAFYDATGLFDAEPRAVYSDTCCHLNQIGNALLADYLVERIAAAL